MLIERSIDANLIVYVDVTVNQVTPIRSLKRLRNESRKDRKFV